MGNFLRVLVHCSLWYSCEKQHYCIILLSLELHIIRIWIQYPWSFIDIGKGLMYVSCWKILTLFVMLYGFWCKPALTMVILLLHLKAMFPFSFFFLSLSQLEWNCDSWRPELWVKLLWFSKLKDNLLHCQFVVSKINKNFENTMTYSMSAVKGQGPRISLSDYEHESWLLPRKQKENITKRTYQLFSSLPTNTYRWQLEMLVTLALLGPITNLPISHTHFSS